MSRSRYCPGFRYDRCDRDEWYAYKRRREDVRSGMVRGKIPKRKWKTSRGSLNRLLHEWLMDDQAKAKRGAVHGVMYPGLPSDYST